MYMIASCRTKNKTCIKCEYAMFYVRVRHVAQENETCITCECVMYYVRMRHVAYTIASLKMRCVSHVNAACITYECVMSHTCLLHRIAPCRAYASIKGLHTPSKRIHTEDTHMCSEDSLIKGIYMSFMKMIASCRAWKWVPDVAHKKTSHVAQRNAPFSTYECVMSHIWLRHVAHENECVVSHKEWVTTH